MKYTCIEKRVSASCRFLLHRKSVTFVWFRKTTKWIKIQIRDWSVRLLGHSCPHARIHRSIGGSGGGGQGVVPWNIFFLPGMYIYELSALEHTPSSLEKGNHRSFPKGIFLDPRKFLMLECCQEQPVAVVLYEWIFFKRFLFNRCLILISMVYIYSDK